MNEKMNFADLDAAVSDLIARTSDDGASSSDRDEIARAEADEFPKNAGALSRKLAKNNSGNDAKNAETLDYESAKSYSLSVKSAEKSPASQSFITRFLSGEKRENADGGVENSQKSPEPSGDSGKKEIAAKASPDKKSAAKTSPDRDRYDQLESPSTEESAKFRARANANFEPATHFRGRFMDIIPPRATVETPENLKRAPKNLAPKIEKFTPEAEEFSRASERPEENSDKADSDHGSALENFATKFEDEVESPVAGNENPDKNAENAADESSEPDEKSDALGAYDSPFLPDANAKVSKRPLGQKNFATPSFETELPGAPTESDLSEDNFITKFLHDEHENAKHFSTAPKSASENFALTSNFSSVDARAAVANVANSAPQNFPAPAKKHGKSVAFAWILVLVLFIAIGVAAGASLYFSGAFQR